MVAMPGYASEPYHKKLHHNSETPTVITKGKAKDLNLPSVHRSIDVRSNAYDIYTYDEILELKSNHSRCN